MSRAHVILYNDTMRERAHKWIDRAPPNTRLEFKAPRRSLEQNDKMWAMLTEVAYQLTWHGKILSTDDWKLVFLDGLARERRYERRVVPSLDGDGFVQLGCSSSDLSTDEMAQLIELIYAFGAQHGVRFKKEKVPDAAA